MPALISEAWQNSTESITPPKRNLHGTEIESRPIIPIKRHRVPENLKQKSIVVGTHPRSQSVEILREILYELKDLKTQLTLQHMYMWGFGGLIMACFLVQFCFYIKNQ
jgi:hypothetical protein